jgi:hypothetical protein
MAGLKPVHLSGSYQSPPPQCTYLADHPRFLAQIRALPDDFLPDFASVYDVLELAPWNGALYNVAKPRARCA